MARRSGRTAKASSCPGASGFVAVTVTSTGSPRSARRARRPRPARPRPCRRRCWRCRENRRRSGCAAARRSRSGRRPGRSARVITTTRSLMVSASSWSCVTRIDVMPSRRWSSRSSNCMLSRRFLSSAPSGSSSSRIVGSVDERARQRDALLLAAGELVDLPRRRSWGAARREHRADARASRSRRRHAPHLQAEGDVLADASYAGTGCSSGTPCRGRAGSAAGR